VLKYTWTRGQ